MDACIIKPIAPARLLGIIDAMVEGSEAMRATAVSET